MESSEKQRKTQTQAGIYMWPHLGSKWAGNMDSMLVFHGFPHVEWDPHTSDETTGELSGRNQTLCFSRNSSYVIETSLEFCWNITEGLYES